MVKIKLYSHNNLNVKLVGGYEQLKKKNLKIQSSSTQRRPKDFLCELYYALVSVYVRHTCSKACMWSQRLSPSTM